MFEMQHGYKSKGFLSRFSVCGKNTWGGGTEDNSQMWQMARGRGRGEEEERGEEEDRQRSFQRKGHLRALPMGTWKWKERQL